MSPQLTERRVRAREPTEPVIRRVPNCPPPTHIMLQEIVNSMENLQTDVDEMRRVVNAMFQTVQRVSRTFPSEQS